MVLLEFTCDGKCKNCVLNQPVQQFKNLTTCGWIEKQMHSQVIINKPEPENATMKMIMDDGSLKIKSLEVSKKDARASMNESKCPDCGKRVWEFAGKNFDFKRSSKAPFPKIYYELHGHEEEENE